MKVPASLLRRAALVSVLSGVSLQAQTFTWKPTVAGTYDWDSPVNWNPSNDFPDGAAATANLNNDIAGAQTIRLRADITIGNLNLGDAAATGANFGYTIANLAGETFELDFDTADPDVDAQLNLSANGTPTNSINVPVTLFSDLQIHFANTVPVGGVNTNSQRLTFNGGDVDFGTQTVTVTGGYVGTGDANQLTFGANSDLLGSGTIVNNGETPIIISNPLNAPKSFAGTVVLNGRGSGASNSASLTLTSGSLQDAAEFVINGALSAGVTQSGGSVQSGDNSAGNFGGANPGQRLTANTITLNGGTLIADGQAMSGVNVATVVVDFVDSLTFNSAYSLITLNANAASAGTQLNITNMDRTFGASAFVRGNAMGAAGQLLVTNASDFAIGADGDEGTTTMSVIPWMVVANANGSAASGDTFAVSAANGIRGLTNAEYAAAITAGVDANVSTASVAVPAASTSVAVNSLRYSAAASSNIGLAKTLQIASGGLIFQNNGGTIGAVGSLTAGTLQFGTDVSPAEGIVWANGTNTNTIGASIAGDLGLSKAGTGTLILTGNNTYAGDTYVGGGTLQVGNGVIPSNLGPEGDVFVANGATLILFNGGAIPDDAALTLENFGLLNGKLTLATGVNELVEALFLGTDQQGPGTWGSTSSAAQFKNDVYFSGTGILTVVPEPASALLALAALPLLAGARGRRRRPRSTSRPPLSR